MLAATPQVALCTIGGIGVAASKVPLLRSLGQRARRAGLNNGPTAATVAGLKTTQFGDISVSHVAKLTLPIAYGRQPAAARLAEFVSPGMHSMQLTDQCMVSGGSELGFERDSNGNCQVIMKGFKPAATIKETEEMLQDKLRAVGPVTLKVSADPKDRSKPADPGMAVIGVPTAEGALALVTYAFAPAMDIYPSRTGGATCEGHPLIERLRDIGPARDQPARELEMEADFGGCQGDIVRSLSRAAAKAAREDPADDAKLGMAYALEVATVRPFGQNRCLVQMTSVAAVAAALQAGLVRFEGLDITIRPSATEGAGRRDIDKFCLVLSNLPADKAPSTTNETVKEVYRLARASGHVLPTTGLAFEPLPTRRSNEMAVKIFPDSEKSMLAVLRQVQHASCFDITGKRKLGIRLASESSIGSSRGGATLDLQLVETSLGKGVPYKQLQQQQQAVPAGGSDASAERAALLQEMRSGFARLDGKIAASGRSLEQLHQVSSRMEGKIDQGNSQMGQLVAHTAENTTTLHQLAADQREAVAAVKGVAAHAEVQVQLLSGMAEEQGSLVASVEAGTKQLQEVLAAMARRKAAAKAAKPSSPSSCGPKLKARRRTSGQGGAEGGDLSSQLAAASEEAASAGVADVDMRSPTKEGEAVGAELDENLDANQA